MPKRQAIVEKVTVGLHLTRNTPGPIVDRISEDGVNAGLNRANRRHLIGQFDRLGNSCLAV